MPNDPGRLGTVSSGRGARLTVSQRRVDILGVVVNHYAGTRRIVQACQAAAVRLPGP